jgi:UDP-N-acetylmuramoyl-tripeptide--D-alanyl-D-alanine ligase
LIAGKVADYLDSISPVHVPESAANTEFKGVSIDSREVRAGNIFFCIVGERHDGHDFIQQALEKGAAAVVIDSNHAYSGPNIIQVPDTLRAMGELARAYLRGIDVRKVAITGTNGKTTCKEMIAAAIRRDYRICVTRGNFNNLYGVPLSIFEFNTDCEIAVLEFGMSTPGEIARLVEIVDPDIRVILNIGPAHLETMGSLDAIADAKFEILQKAKETDWAVLNLDDPLIRARYGDYPIAHLSFGEKTHSDVTPQHVYLNSSSHYHLEYLDQDIRVPILGRHHIPNILASLAVGRLLDVALPRLKEGLENYQPEGHRMCEVEVAGVTIINDAYNANPVSVRGVLHTIGEYNVSGRKFVVLGDMLELGAEAARLHAELGVDIVDAGVDRLILPGEFASTVADAAVAAGFDRDAIEVVQRQEDIVALLLDELEPGDLLLLKASRRMQLETIELSLRAELGRQN